MRPVDRRRRLFAGVLAACASAAIAILPMPGCESRHESHATPAPAPGRPFQKLSQYGLFVGDPAAQQPAAGVIPYDLNSALFSDYTEKFRFVKLPAGNSASYRSDDVFDLPVGTVIAKTFAYPRDARDPSKGAGCSKRGSSKHEADGWVGLPYIWNQAQTEATLDVAGDTVDVSWIHSDGDARSNNYIIPNSNQCKGCHKAGETMLPIGPKARNLNRDFAYADGQGKPTGPLEPSGHSDRSPRSRRRASAGRLGRPQDRHARRPRPRLARDQLRPLPQPAGTSAELGPRPARLSAKPNIVWDQQAAGCRRRSAPVGSLTTSFQASPIGRSSSIASRRLIRAS